MSQYSAGRSVACLAAPLAVAGQLAPPEWRDGVGDVGTSVHKPRQSRSPSAIEPRGFCFAAGQTASMAGSSGAYLRSIQGTRRGHKCRVGSDGVAGVVVRT